MKNKKLTAARKAKRMTQEELAKMLGYKGKQTVANWENGHSTPPLATAIEISKVLGRDVAVLFGKDVQESYTNEPDNPKFVNQKRDGFKKLRKI